MNYIILISTPDSRGLVHKISSNLLDFNIEKNDEFVDRESEHFFMRTEISVEGNLNESRVSATESRPIRGAKNRIQTSSSASADFLLERDLRGSPPKSEKRQLLARRGSGAGGAALLRKETSESNGKSVDCFGDESPRNDESSANSYDSTQSAIESRLRKVLPPQSFIKITPKRKKSIVIFCTKEAHCLGDLLMKHYNNELDIDIKAIISNYESLQSLVEKFHIPYFHISHDSPRYEDSMLEVCANFAPDFIVLAKYMRILSQHFISHYENRIINIHHSFLPAFIGANPYKQAYTRGVKIIGATAHFVTSELDSGPIICQDIMQVNHTFSWQDMQKAGKNIERVVLARAVELAIDERIFIHKNKTIIF